MPASTTEPVTVWRQFPAQAWPAVPVMDVNVLGIVRVSRAAMPHLRLSISAAIVNVDFIAGTAGRPERALYSASKGAVHASTRAMAADHPDEVAIAVAYLAGPRSGLTTGLTLAVDGGCHSCDGSPGRSPAWARRPRGTHRVTSPHRWTRTPSASKRAAFARAALSAVCASGA